MVLLKAAEFAESKDKKQSFNLKDVEVEARAIIAGAQREAREIVAKSRVDVDAAIATARDEGYKQGYKEGVEQGQADGHRQALQEAKDGFEKETSEVVKALTATLTCFDQNKDELLWRAEQGAVVLAIGIAEKIVKRAICSGPQVAAENVKAALVLLGKTTDVVIQLNPEELRHISEMSCDELAIGHYGNIRFEPNETVQRGGCKLRTEQGEIDAQIETQIARIAEELVSGELTLSRLDDKERDINNNDGNRNGSCNGAERQDGQQDGRRDEHEDGQGSHGQETAEGQ